MLSRKQIGLVGCGNWGKNILCDLVSLGCKVTVVARSEASIQRAQDFGATRVVSSVSQLPRVDGISIARKVKSSS